MFAKNLTSSVLSNTFTDSPLTSTAFRISIMSYQDTIYKYGKDIRIVSQLILRDAYFMDYSVLIVFPPGSFPVPVKHKACTMEKKYK